MKLYHIQHDLTIKISFNDSLITKILLLISNPLAIESRVSSFLDIQLTIFSVLTEDDYLTWSIRRFPKESKEYKSLADAQRVLRQIRGLKIKSKEVLVAYSRLKQNIADMRKNHKEIAEDDLKRLKIWELMYFCDKELIEFGSHYNQDSLGLEYYIEKLKKVLCLADYIPVLELDPKLFPDVIDWEIMKQKSNTEKLPDFICQTLYKIPDISDFTAEQLEYLRDNILRKISSFNNQIDDLRKACLEIEYKEENWNEIKELLAEKLNGYKELQKEIDVEIYLQQVKNSGVNFYAEVSIGIASVRTVAEYFEKSGNTKPFVATSLYQRIEMFGSSTRCGVFVNISVKDYNGHKEV